MKHALFSLLLGLAGVVACTPADHHDPANPDQESQQRDLSEPGSAVTDMTGTERRAESGGYSRAEERLHQTGLQGVPDSIAQFVSQQRADGIQQCEVVGIGHSPCGGPDRYIVFSNRGLTDNERQQLREEVRRYNSMEQEIRGSEEMADECEPIAQPTVGFENGRCVAEFPQTER